MKNADLHILVRDEYGRERIYKFNWTEEINFAKRIIDARDNESLELCGITGKIFVSQDGVPEAPRAVTVHGTRLVISHEANKNFFHVEKLGHAVTILEISAADHGSRSVTYQKIAMPEGLELIASDNRVMVSDVWSACQVATTSPDSGLAPKKHIAPLSDADLELEIPAEVR